MHKEYATENTLLSAYFSVIVISLCSFFMIIIIALTYPRTFFFLGLTNLLKYVVSLSINITQFPVRPENVYSSLFRNSFITHHLALTRPFHSPFWHSLSFATNVFDASIQLLLCYVSFPAGRSSLPLLPLGSRTFFCYTKFTSRRTVIFLYSTKFVSRGISILFYSTKFISRGIPFSSIPLRSLAEAFPFSFIPLSSKADAAPVMPSSQKFSDSS